MFRALYGTNAQGKPQWTVIHQGSGVAWRVYTQADANTLDADMGSKVTWEKVTPSQLANIILFIEKMLGRPLSYVA